jgi:NAD(P)-dependent dehydrogenase (short-subunit alcohol dehydrogenase family)
MSLFLPFLKSTSADPRIINVSSTTGSFGLSDKFPKLPAGIIPYSMSKTALNMLTLAYTKTVEAEGVLIQSGGPGLCRTDLNFASKTRPGARDPIDGAKVFVSLALAEKGEYPNGFWQQMDGEDEPVAVPW